MRQLALVVVILTLAWSSVWGATAQIDTFQCGIFPESTWVGAEDATFRTNTGETYNTLNYGATPLTGLTFGYTPTGAVIARAWFRWTPGNYLSKEAIIDSALWDYYMSSGAADIGYAYYCLKRVEEGDSNGVADPGAICWNSWQYPDSLWNTAGAGTVGDSTQVDSTLDVAGPFAAWSYSATAGWKTANFTNAVKAWLSGAVPNYGWVVRDSNEAAGKSIVYSSEDTGFPELRWRMRVYSHEAGGRKLLGRKASLGGALSRVGKALGIHKRTGAGGADQRGSALFVVGSDIHYGETLYPETSTGLIHYLHDKNIQPDAWISAGDLITYDLPSRDSVLALRDSLGPYIPLYSSEGNHDHARDGPDSATTLDSTDAYHWFRDQQPQAGAHGAYYVDIGPVRWIFIPNSTNEAGEPCSVNCRTRASPAYVYEPLSADSGATNFAVDDSELWNFVENALTNVSATIKWKMVVAHHPTRNLQWSQATGDWAWGQYDDDSTGTHWGNMIQRKGCDFFFSGHQQMYGRYHPTRDHVIQIGSALGDDSCTVHIIGPNVDVSHMDSTTVDTTDSWGEDYGYIPYSLAAWDPGTTAPLFGLLRISGDYATWTVMDTTGVVKDFAAYDKR